MERVLVQNKGDAFLLATGSSSDLALLTGEKLLFEILKNLPPFIGMNALSKPIISVAEGNPGLEGYVPIDMSNITISTYMNNPRFVACIHSCNDFDYQKALGYLKEKFRCRNVKFLYCNESDFGD